MSEFTTLGELAREGRVILNDGYRTRSDELGEPGVPILRVAEVQDGHITPSFGDHVRSEFRSKFGMKTSATDDVVVTTKGTVGRVALMRSHHPEFVYSPQVCFFRCAAGSGVVPEWLYYWFKGPEFISQALGVQAQTDMAPYINLADMRALNISVPRTAEQRAIAGVLGALDDKIESNRRLVGVLLDLAQAEFDCRYGSSSINMPLSSLAEVVDCLHTRKPQRQHEGQILLQLSNIGDNGTIVPANHFPIDAQDYERWTANIEASEGDLVVTNVGRVAAVGRIPAGFRGALGRNMTAVRPKRKEDRAFLATALTNLRVRRVMLGLVDAGTIMDALNVHAIRRVMVPEADPLDRAAFEVDLGPLLCRVDRCVAESLSLASLRDALLPELLTGRLRVRDAEQAVSEAL